MIKCPACLSENNTGPLQTYHEVGIDYEYTRHSCIDCGVEFWTPLIMPPASYYEQAEGDYIEFHEKGSDVIKWWHKSFMDNFSGLNIKGKVLDIGCADGRFLKKMKQQGWDIYGLDLDKKSVGVAKINCQTENIYNCYFEEFIEKVEPQSFDIVTFFEVLEHQSDPIKFIEGIKKILKPGGWIAGSVPNTDRYVVSKRFSPDNPPHHFTLWRRNSLHSFFTGHGFAQFQLHNTRYEPIVIDQFIRQYFYDAITKIKNENSTKTLDNLNRKKISHWVILFGKNYILYVFKILCSLFEYPYLLLTRKSVSMFFESKLVK